MIDLSMYRTPPEVQKDLATRMVQRRKELKLSQEKLASKSGVSLGSLKRFERTSEISLTSLLKLAFALEDLESFDSVFTKKHYNSIEEVINETKNARRSRN